jgi:hypothetical protein
MPVNQPFALNGLKLQWIAGRGTGTNPHSVLCTTRQARRVRPSRHLRRHAPEPRGLDMVTGIDRAAR